MTDSPDAWPLRRSKPLLSLDEVRAVARAQRRRRGLSQDAAAGLIGHSQKWLSDFERGRTDPPASMLIALLVLLGIPLSVGEVDAPWPGAPGALREDEREIDLDEGL